MKNVGSWLEIGNSLSRYGILNTQVVFVLFLFGLSNVYTRGLDLGGDGPAMLQQGIPQSFSVLHGSGVPSLPPDVTVDSKVE